MKLTNNALSMLLNAYRAVLKNSFLKNTLTAVATITLGVNCANANNTLDQLPPPQNMIM